MSEVKVKVKEFSRGIRVMTDFANDELQNRFKLALVEDAYRTFLSIPLPPSQMKALLDRDQVEEWKFKFGWLP